VRCNAVDIGSNQILCRDSGIRRLNAGGGKNCGNAVRKCGCTDCERRVR
jgi:hypothetical protein